MIIYENEKVFTNYADANDEIERINYLFKNTSKAGANCLKFKVVVDFPLPR